jgi:transcriptional/translational regulatory protein YebC/TACO1
MHRTLCTLAGHNRMSKILRGKGIADSAKAIAFSRVSRRITAAARAGGIGGGSSTSSSEALNDALQEARNLRVPKDLIERALKNASGDGAIMETVIYEGSVRNISILIETLTDNKNRTSAAIRSLLTKAGGSLGSSSWAFKVLGKLSIVGSIKDKKFVDAVIAAAVDADALEIEIPELEDDNTVMVNKDDEEEDEDCEDIITDEDVLVFCEKEKLGYVRNKLEEAKLFVRSSSIVRLPISLVSISEGEEEEKMQALLEALERNEDVQKVVHNVSFNLKE